MLSTRPTVCNFSQFMTILTAHVSQTHPKQASWERRKERARRLYPWKWQGRSAHHDLWRVRRFNHCARRSKWKAGTTFPGCLLGSEYEAQTAAFCGIVGRYANRLRMAPSNLPEETYSHSKERMVTTPARGEPVGSTRLCGSVSNLQTSRAHRT